VGQKPDQQTNPQYFPDGIGTGFGNFSCLQSYAARAGADALTYQCLRVPVLSNQRAIESRFGRLQRNGEFIDFSSDSGGRMNPATSFRCGGFESLPA
jgi:hypothetical protein